MQDAPLTQTFVGLPRPRPSLLRRIVLGEPQGERAGALAPAFAQLEEEGFRVFPYGEVGHTKGARIVVGATGIFVVRANAWRGRFYFRRDGWLKHTRKDPGPLVADMGSQVAAVRARLGDDGGPAPQVEGVVVIVRSRMKHPLFRMGRVTFVSAAKFVHYIRSRRPGLTSEQIERAAADIAA